ncbi:MAG TPA: (2Fe-2S)-binding protein [Candidatus Limnocylindria bacterium]|nr:(2Fe-2S)-binding protein [Candidatus Limnocylindria bacterium]
MPPTFYHHRFLHPRRLRKAYLDVIRWFGGRGALRWHGDRRPTTRPAREASCDVLVVGCGPGGVAAARAAAEAGARVIALEADPGWARAAPPSTEVRVLADTTALGIYDGVCAAVDADGTWEIRADQIIVATGSYDRVPSVPGADRPGVMAARLVARLVERDAILPGRRAVLIGSGPDLDLAGTILRSAGASTSGPHATHQLRRVSGRGGVRGVELLRDGASVTERAHLVVFGDRVPALEMLLQAGAEMEWRGDHPAPIVDDDGRTSLAGFFAVGGAAGRSGDLAAAGRAGKAAADAARSRPSAAVATTWSRGEPHLHGPVTNRVPGDAIVCFCEDVRAREIAAELDAGYGQPELLKRRTGALTGPCQGKYCLAAVACAAGVAGDWVPPTARPPLRPVRLAELAGAHPLAERPTST